MMEGCLGLLLIAFWVFIIFFFSDSEENNNKKDCSSHYALFRTSSFEEYQSFIENFDNTTCEIINISIVTLPSNNCEFYIVTYQEKEP